MRFPIQNHHDAACFLPLVTTDDFSFLTLYKRNGEEKTSLKLKLVKGAREWSTKSSSTLNSNECNYVPAAPCKAARLAIDPFENQIKSNWNAVLAEQLRSDLNLCKRLRKLCRRIFSNLWRFFLSPEPLEWIFFKILLHCCLISRLTDLLSLQRKTWNQIKTNYDARANKKSRLKSNFQMICIRGAH